MKLGGFRKGLLVVALCFSALSFTGCSGSGNSSSSGTSVTLADLVGTWKQMTLNSTDVSGDGLITVFEATTYTYKEAATGVDAGCSETGSWTMSGNTITFSPAASSTCGDTAAYSLTITAFNGTTLSESRASFGNTLTLQKQTNLATSITAADFVGTWKGMLYNTTDISSYNDLIVFDTTTYTYTQPAIGDNQACSESGTWSVSGNTITYSPASSSTCGDTTPYAETIATYDGTTVTSTRDGNVMTLRKQTTSSSTGVPAAPAGLQAAAGDKTVTLSWTSVPGATGYYIYESETSGVTETNYLQKLTTNTDPQGLNGFTNGTTYYFIVTAVNANGESTASAQVSATPTASGTTTSSVPAAPTGVHAVAGDGRITMSWTAVPGATSYNIYWSTATGVSKANGQVLLNQTNPQGLTVPNGTTYYFVVTALNANGESAESAEVSATAELSAPAGVTATTDGIAYGSMQISWNPVSGATSYNIYASTTKGVTKATGTKYPNVSNPATFTGTAGTTYYFVVTALDSNGESAESVQVCAVPQDGRYYIPCTAY